MISILILRIAASFTVVLSSDGILRRAVALGTLRHFLLLYDGMKMIHLHFSFFNRCHHIVLSILHVILYVTLCLTDVNAFTTVGIQGFPWMFYDYQRNKVILSGQNIPGGFKVNPYVIFGWYTSNNLIYSYDPLSNDVELLAGSYTSYYQVDGTGSNASFRNLRSVTPYYVKGKIEGYFVPDNCVLRYVTSNVPASVTSVIFIQTTYSCQASVTGSSPNAMSGYISSIAVNPLRNIYVSADYDYNKIYLLTNFTTSSMYYNGTFFNKIRSMVFLNDTLYVADDDNRVSALLSNASVTYITRVGFKGYISSIKVYSNTFVITKYNESNTSVYYGTNLSSLTRSSCVSPGNYTVDTVVLPNGTVLQTQNSTVSLYLLNCSLFSYNVTNVTFKRTSSITLNNTRSLRDTSSNTRSHSKDTRSDSATLSDSEDTLSDTFKVSGSNSIGTSDVSRSNSIVTSKSMSDTGVISRSYTETPKVSNSISETSKVTVSITNTASSDKTSIKSVTFIKRKSVSVSRSNTMSLSKKLSNETFHSISVTRKIHSISVTRMKEIVSKVSNLVVSIGVTSNVMASVTGGMAGGRTSIFLSILNGQCGSTRELEIYEDPFRASRNDKNNLVVLGNIGFMCITFLLLFWLSRVYDVIAYNRIDLIGIKEGILKYHLIDILFIEWGLFLPGIMTSFPDSEKVWLSIGILFILITLLWFLYGLHHVSILVTSDDITVIWEGNSLILPIIEGYTSKVNACVDIMMNVVMSGLTILDNCSFLAILTICLNVTYSIYILYFRTIQPKSILYSSVIFSLGQSIVIIIVISGRYEAFAGVTFYLVTVIGITTMFFPVLKKIYNAIRGKLPINEKIPDVTIDDTELLLVLP